MFAHTPYKYLIIHHTRTTSTTTTNKQNLRIPCFRTKFRIIYAILKNKYIDDEVKSSMRQAAQMAYQQKHGQCSQYQCLRIKPTRT